MKTENSDKSFITWLVLVVATAVVCTIIGYSVRGVEDKPEYTPTDSIEILRLDSLNRISFEKLKNAEIKANQYISFSNDLKKNNKQLEAELKEILKNKDIPCETKLKKSVTLNDSLRSECNVKDSAIYELDIECQEYSNINYNLQLQKQIEIKRNFALSDSISSLHVSYTDSLTAIRKTSDKAIKKEKRTTLFYKVTTTLAATLGIYGTIR
jgi:hypothetical protein